MTKLIERFKQHKKIIIVSVLLIIFVILGVVLYGNSARTNISQTSSDTVRSEAETKLMRILSEIEGVGETEVFINEAQGKVEGVVIVCEGANNIMTRNNVLNAVVTALNIEKFNVAIYAMNK